MREKIRGNFREGGLGGFSLLELLSVVAILGILAVATLPALRGTLSGYQIHGAADVLGADMSLARQVAMTRNVPTEVRLYKIRRDGDDQEEWCALGIVIPAAASGQSADEWVVAVRALPASVIVDGSATYSTLLDQPEATEAAGAPAMVRGKKYVAFQFNPDGSTNLSKNSTWSLTLRNAKGRPEGGAPAANYAVFVFDPLTGRASYYQP